MLSRIKMGLPEIRKAILDIDDSKLLFDDLKAISRHLPTIEEVRPSASLLYRTTLIYFLHRQIGRIKDFEDVSKLAKADQYFNQVSVSFIHPGIIKQ
jgi:diaphanous 1